MVKNILINCDEAFFYKMKKHKYELEKLNNTRISWSEYFKLLFGMK